MALIGILAALAPVFASGLYLGIDPLLAEGMPDEEADWSWGLDLSHARNSASGGMYFCRAHDFIEEEQPSQCKTCRSASRLAANAPRLYINGRHDGLGARACGVIAGMAFAASHGFAFGGVVVPSNECHVHVSHGQHLTRVYGAIFGLRNPEALFTDSPPTFDRTFHQGPYQASRYLRKHGMPNARENWYLTSAGGFWAGGRFGEDYLTHGFLMALRRQSALPTMPDSFKPGSISVAVHVRRGDVSNVSNANRFTSNEWYYSLLQQLTEIDANLDIHIFSSLEGRNEDSSFDGFRSRGMTVHLDGDILDPLVHFAKAEVLVMGKGSFSVVPAYMNGKCVIAQGSGGLQSWQSEWIKTTKESKPLQSDQLKKLSACLTRIKTEKRASR